MTARVWTPITNSPRRSASCSRDLLKQRIARLDAPDSNFSLALGAAGLLLVSALGWLLIRDITRPLAKPGHDRPRHRAAARLDAPVTVEPRRDEIGELAEALRRMITAQHAEPRGARRKQRRDARGQRKTPGQDRPKRSAWPSKPTPPTAPSASSSR